MSGGLRDKMPFCSACVDSLREVFGKDEIDNVIRRGLRPDCKPEHRVFFAEAGFSLGQRPSELDSAVSVAEMVVGPQFTMPTKRGRS